MVTWPMKAGVLAVISVSCLALLLAIELPAMARQTPSGQPYISSAALTIEGIQIGMPAHEVLARLQRESGSITVDHRPCVADYVLAAQRDRALANAAKSCTQSILMRQTGRAILIFFTEDLPKHPSVSVATIIAINLMGTYGLDDPVSLDIIHRFGRPTITDGKRPWIVADWCTSRCTMNGSLSDPNATAVLLLHRGSGLTLDDNAYITIRQSAIANALLLHHIHIEP